MEGNKNNDGQFDILKPHGVVGVPFIMKPGETQTINCLLGNELIQKQVIDVSYKTLVNDQIINKTINGGSFHVNF